MTDRVVFPARRFVAKSLSAVLPLNYYKSNIVLRTCTYNQSETILFKVLKHLKFCTLFFDVLPFTDDASVVNGKTS